MRVSLLFIFFFSVFPSLFWGIATLPTFLNQCDWNGGHFSSQSRGSYLDLNGDSYMDILYSNHDYSDKHSSIAAAYISTGSAWVSTPSWNPPAFVWQVDWHDGGLSTNTRAQFIDLNQDGLQDIVYSNHDYSDKDSTLIATYINTGSKWDRQSQWDTPQFITQCDWHDGYFTNSERGQFIDLNGDLLPDLVLSNHDYSGKKSSINEVYINTGNGWKSESQWRLPSFLYQNDWHKGDLSSTIRGQFADLNGDGLVDLVFSNHDYSDKKSSISMVYRNTGNGWASHSSLDPPTFVWQNDWNDGHLTYVARGQFVDINGDRLADLVYSLSDYSEKKSSITASYLNKNGSSWERDSKWDTPANFTECDWHKGHFSSIDRGVFVDLTGNTVVDLVYANHDESEKHNSYLATFESTDNGWVKHSSFNLPYSDMYNDWHDGQLTVAPRAQFQDLNGNGMNDLMYSNHDYSTKGISIEKCYLNNRGNSWTPC